MTLDYNPDADIPNLAGKVIFVTGGTTGLGKETVLQLAKHNPKHIYFTGRNVKAADAVISEARKTSSDVTFIPCEQTDLCSVAHAAHTFLESSGNQLDILICNAGVMAMPPGVSKDGYEIQFAINHLAHALFIKLFLPSLERAAEEKGDARIVLLTSLAFRDARKDGIVFKDLKSSQENMGSNAKWYLYAQSKLANVLYASQLAVEHPNLTVAAVHPGVMTHGDLKRYLGKLDYLIVKIVTLRMLHVDEHEGAYNTLWAATSVDGKKVRSGEVYEPVGKPVPPTKYSSDRKLAKELWDWTEKELNAYVS